MKRSKKWAKRFGITAAVLVVLYIAGGFFVAPSLVRYVGLPMAREQVQGDVQVASISVNPLTLSLTLEGLDIRDAQGEPAIQAEKIYANASIATLWREGICMDAVDLVKPVVFAEINAEGELNLASLAAASDEPPSEKPTPLIPVALRLERFLLDAAEVRFRDQRLEPTYQTSSQFTITLNDFATTPNQANGYDLSGSLSGGGTFEWAGEILVEPLTLRGTLKVQGVALTPANPYIAQILPVQISRGLVGAEIDFDIAPGGSSPVAVTTIRDLQARDIELLDSNGSLLTTFETYEVSQARIDGVSHEVDVENIVYTGGKTLIRRSPEGVMNVLAVLDPEVDYAAMFPKVTVEALTAGAAAPSTAPATQRFAAPTQPQTAPDTRPATQANPALSLNAASASHWGWTWPGSAHAQTIAPPEEVMTVEQLTREVNALSERAATSQWTIRVQSVAVRNKAVAWLDEAVSPRVELYVGNLNLSAGPVSSVDGFASDVEVSLGLASGGTIAAQGRVDPLQLNSEVEVAIQDLALPALSAYLNDAMPGHRIAEGTLSIDGRVTTQGNGGALPKVTYVGNLGVRTLDVVLDGQESALVAWDTLAVTEIDTELDLASLGDDAVAWAVEQAVKVGSVEMAGLQGFYVDASVEPAATLSISEVAVDLKSLSMSDGGGTYRVSGRVLGPGEFDVTGTLAR